MSEFTPYPIALGPIDSSSISITIKPSDLKLSESIEKRIDEIWHAKEIEAKEKELNFFNGTSYRVNAWKYKNGILLLELAIFDFKHRYGLVTMCRNGEIDETEIIQGGCFVGATVKTSDGRYLMVKQSGKSALNLNVYDVLGGMAETDIPCTGGTYFHNVLKQELEEEGGIKESEITSCELNMVFAGTNGHYGFYFDVEINITALELIERHTENTDIDIESLHTYSYDEYIYNLENHFSSNKKLLASFLKGELEK